MRNSVMAKNGRREAREFPRVYPVEMRAEEREGGARTISGYAAVFDSETVIGNWWREVIRRGAFNKTLQESDQAALWNHDDGKPLGRKSEGTLRLWEDERGLRFEIGVDDRTWSEDAWKSVKRGDVKGASFRFRVVKEAWTSPEDPKDLPQRELIELKLYEVSPVTFPAYEATEIDARAVLRSAEERGLIHRADDAATGEPDGGHSDKDVRSEPEDVHSAAGAKDAGRIRREIRIRENEYIQRRLKNRAYFT